MMVLIILAGCGYGGDKKDTGASGEQIRRYLTLTSVDVSGNGQEVSAEDMNISGSLNVESNGIIHIDLVMKERDGEKCGKKKMENLCWKLPVWWAK